MRESVINTSFAVENGLQLTNFFTSLFVPGFTMLLLWSLVVLYLFHARPLFVNACFGPGAPPIGLVQTLASPATSPPKNVQWKRIALTNVRVFDGTTILPPSTVIIDGPRIGLNGNITVDETIDGGGGTLIPGLIEAHAHPLNITHLQQFVSYGVTTVMGMSCNPEPVCNTLRGQTGLADLHTAGLVATSPNSTHAMLHLVPATELIASPADAPQFISNRVGNGTDYIKLIAEANGMTQAEHDSLVSTAHASGMQVMTHAADFSSYQQAILSRTDNIQHIPADSPLTEGMLQAMMNASQVATPTLTVTQVLINLLHPPTWSLATAKKNVQALQNAKIPILAGTDANDASIGFPIPFGSSLHGELELLNQAGLSTLDVLTAATKRSAFAHGLWDRGVIKPGYRADLVLIKGDPLSNISNTKNIERIWAGGIEYTGKKFL